MRILYATVVVLLGLLLLVAAADAATLTVPGVPRFDTSLGTLQSAEVTVDPLPPLFYIHPLSLTPMPNHQHSATYPSFEIGGKLFSFPTTLTEVGGSPDPAGFETHGHTFDPPAVTVQYDNGELSYFLDPSPIVITGIQFGSISTDIVEGHSHKSAPVPLNLNAAATTTFTYIPVPEPAFATIATGLLTVTGVWRLLQRPQR